MMVLKAPLSAPTFLWSAGLADASYVVMMGSLVNYNKESYRY